MRSSLKTVFAVGVLLSTGSFMGSGRSFASDVDSDTETAEPESHSTGPLGTSAVLGALSHCVNEFAESMTGAHSVGAVRYVSPRPATPGLLIDVWSIPTLTGGLFPDLSGVKVSSTLIITQVTDTRVNPAIPSRPNKVTYTCRVIKG